jgi:hypothetical protein
MKKNAPLVDQLRKDYSEMQTAHDILTGKLGETERKMAALDVVLSIYDPAHVSMEIRKAQYGSQSQPFRTPVIDSTAVRVKPEQTPATSTELEVGKSKKAAKGAEKPVGKLKAAAKVTKSDAVKKGEVIPADGDVDGSKSAKKQRRDTAEHARANEVITSFMGSFDRYGVIVDAVKHADRGDLTAKEIVELVKEAKPIELTTKEMEAAHTSRITAALYVLHNKDRLRRVEGRNSDNKKEVRWALGEAEKVAQAN